MATLNCSHCRTAVFRIIMTNSSYYKCITVFISKRLIWRCLLKTKNLNFLFILIALATHDLRSYDGSKMEHAILVKERGKIE